MSGEWEFDRDSWRWSVSLGGPVGPAGLASAWLSSGVRLDVDAWSGAMVRLEVDATTADGQVDPVDAKALLTAVVDIPATSAPPRMRTDNAAVLSRLVRIIGSEQVAAAMGTVTDAWEAEAGELFGELQLADPGRPAGAVAERLSEASLDRSAAQLAARPVDFGALPVEGGRVAIDPSTVVTGLLELVDGADAEWHPPTALRVEIPVRRDVYAPEIGRLACVVRDGGDVIAMQPLAVGLGRAGEPVAVADLTVSTERPAESLAILVTSDPRRLPSAALVAGRAAVHLARTAATAHRLGAIDLADQLMLRWRHRAEQAGKPTEFDGEVPGELPFLGELTG